MALLSYSVVGVGDWDPSSIDTFVGRFRSPDNS